MNPKFLLNSLVLAMAGLLAGCGAGNGGGAIDTPTTTVPLTVLPSTPTIFFGNPTQVSINGGVPPYRIYSNNTGIISFPSQNVDGSQAVISAQNVDATTQVPVEVIDAQGSVSTVPVTVNPAPIATLTIRPDPAAPGEGCAPAVCSGQTALVEVKLTNGSGAAIVGRTVKFENMSSTGVVGGGGNYKFVDAIYQPTPVSTETTSITDATGVAQARILVDVNAPTQYALMKVTDQTNLSFRHGNFTIAQFTDGAGTLTVLPDTATITDYYKDGICSSGAQVDYRIYGGTPPYSVAASFPTTVTITNAPITSNGGYFRATTRGSCVNPVTFTITDATGRTITAELINQDGAEEPPVSESVDVPSVTPAPGTFICGQTKQVIISGGESTTYVSTNAYATDGNLLANATVAGSLLTLSVGATAYNNSAQDADTNNDVVSVYVSDATSVVRVDLTVPESCLPPAP